jgi:glycosyltransferase involved in cell wall biosynthesis
MDIQGLKVIQVHNWYRLRGGEGVVFQATVDLLKRKGNPVSLMTRDSQNIGGSFRRKLNALVSSLYSLSAASDMARIIRLEDPDVVHVHNIYPYLSPSILAVCRRVGIPVVMTCHNYRLLCPTGALMRNGHICELCVGGREYWCALKNCRGNILESFGYALRGTMTRKLRSFHKNVTMFIALTKFAKVRLVASGIEAEHIAILPNMVILEDLPVDHSNCRYVAFAGRLSAEKGLKTLIKAAAELPEVPFRFVGDGPIARSLVQRSSPNVAFLGHVDAQEMMRFYQNARFLVMPSECFEMFPLVIGEAMGHCLPVIASRIGGLPEIVEDGVTGLLFEPGNVEDLVSKIKLLWENPSLCRQMGIAGREKAIREYNENVYYRRLMDVYERAITQINSSTN